MEWKFFSSCTNNYIITHVRILSFTPQHTNELVSALSCRQIFHLLRFLLFELKLLISGSDKLNILQNRYLGDYAHYLAL